MSVKADSDPLWLLVNNLLSQKISRNPSGNYMDGQVCVTHLAENNPSIGAVLVQAVVRQCGLCNG